jgi:hypothetical protein
VTHSKTREAPWFYVEHLDLFFCGTAKRTKVENACDLHQSDASKSGNGCDGQGVTQDESESHASHFTRQVDGSQASLRRRGGVAASLRRRGVVAALRRRCVKSTDLKPRASPRRQIDR